MSHTKELTNADFGVKCRKHSLSAVVHQALVNGTIFEPDRNFSREERENRHQILKRYRTLAKKRAAEDVRKFGFPTIDRENTERWEYIRSRIRNLRQLLEERYYDFLLKQHNCTCCKK